MAPHGGRRRVYVGNSGGEMGVRGWFGGAGREYRQASLARRTARVPTQDVLIGPDFKPHYPADQGKDLGVIGWPPQAWKIGGGDMWGWVTLRCRAHTALPRHGKSRTLESGAASGRQQMDGGHFLRATRRPARRAGTTNIRRTMSTTTTAINEQILLDMPFDGKMQKVLDPHRSQRLYLRDRAATPAPCCPRIRSGRSIPSQGIDLRPGRPIMNPEKETKVGETVTQHLSRRPPGAKDWNPSSFSPAHRAFSTSRTRTCAWIGRTCRSTTSPALPTSARWCT